MVKKGFLWVTLIGLMSLVRLDTVYAQKQYSIKEMTPEVQSALDNRRDRYEKLSELKVKGIVGENNQGYVTVLRKDEGAEAIVNAENNDRKIIYTTIAKQNGLTDALGTIERVFAQEQRERAKPGEKIQNEDGRWVVK